MPFQQSRQVNFPRIVTFIVFSLVFGVGLLFAIVRLSGSGEIQFKLGDDVFEVGDAEVFAERIRSDESPIAWASLSGSRPIYVQHIGNDHLTGWFAIDARSPSDPVWTMPKGALLVCYKRLVEAHGVKTFSVQSVESMS